MPNEQNLIPFTSEQNREEAAKNGRKGGKASVASRRKRKALRAAMQELLALPPDSPEAQAALAGLHLEGVDNQTAMLAGLLKAAMTGDVKAVQEVRNIIGDSRDTAAERAERKARTDKLWAEAAAAQAKVNGVADCPDDGFLDALRGEVTDSWSE